jgi:hypothetical protein
VDEVLSELDLALAECRAHMAHQKDNEALEYLAEAARKIEQALKLLKWIN